eukprot:GHVR01118897.1.p1 GENE.GHVR01118897.1~~GHVR01118897.1.p1  ORF type:complete len:245 (+),score=23.19 GHVR01118897.1:393-1127(+)
MVRTTCTSYCVGNMFTFNIYTHTMFLQFIVATKYGCSSSVVSSALLSAHALSTLCAEDEANLPSCTEAVIQTADSKHHNTNTLLRDVRNFAGPVVTVESTKDGTLLHGSRSKILLPVEHLIEGFCQRSGTNPHSPLDNTIHQNTIRLPANYSPLHPNLPRNTRHNSTLQSVRRFGSSSDDNASILWVLLVCGFLMPPIAVCAWGAGAASMCVVPRTHYKKRMAAVCNLIMFCALMISFCAYLMT